ncbi:MAG TPA: hypothetical protein VGD74_10760, partial [Vulgatibacter sp.]
MRQVPWIALVFAACATAPRPPATGDGTSQPAALTDRQAAREGDGPPPSSPRQGPTRWVDAELGFEIERPGGDEWDFSPGHEAPEGIVVPVIV